MERDEHYMRLALAEAAKGQGRTSPNPCVGAVIVRDDRVVGTGYHRKAGTPHAEVHAIGNAGTACQGATMYVTLEPCNHTGRTPPCTEAILAAGIRRVVIGMGDPNPRVRGGGARYLQEQGVEVVTGLLEEACRRLNYPFLKHSATGQPWVIMKAGMSLDGRISWARDRGGRITGSASWQMVHRLRDRVDAILIGSHTACIDNPSLTCRLEQGAGKDPVRIVLDTHLRLSPRARMLQQDSEAPTWIFSAPDVDPERVARLEEQGAVIHRVETDGQGYLHLPDILAYLGERDITSLLVEGGAAVHASFLCHGLVDQVYLFVAPCFIGQQGTPLVADLTGMHPDTCQRLQELEIQKLDQDILVQGLFNTAYCCA